jgi:hypothetical protein
MRKLAALAIVMALNSMALNSPALSQSREDKEACAPDVSRLCKEFIPDRPRIIACMTEHKRALSPECFKVFSRPASASDDGRRRRKSVAEPAGQAVAD